MSRPVTILSVVVLLSISMTACADVAESPQPANSTLLFTLGDHEVTTANSIRWVGALDPTASRRIADGLERDGVRYLIISSSVADNDTAFGLGNYFHSRQDVILVIDGQCISGCFSVLAAAASEVWVTDGSLYAYRGSPVFTTELMVRHGLQDHDRFLHVAADGEVLRSLYHRLGLSPQILVDAGEKLLPNGGYVENVGEDSHFFYDRLFWVPSPEYLAQHSIDLQGDLIMDRGDAARRVSRHIPREMISSDSEWGFE